MSLLLKSSTREGPCESAACRVTRKGFKPMGGSL
jgi:hypothetical protein